MREVVKAAQWIFITVACIVLPTIASAQEGTIAGVVRDPSDAVLPGVQIEVTSPALIERTRSTTTDGSGQYQITNLPVGLYTVTFTLEGFNKLERRDVELTTGFTANITVAMTVGRRDETVTVRGTTPVVDIQNARQVTTFSGEQLRDLPTARNIPSILALTPGIASSANQFGGLSGVCSGGAGVFCSPIISNFNAHASYNDTLDGLRQGRILVDGVPVNAGVQGLISGATGGYMADIGNAAEVNLQISGALGESETGGAAINIVPLTGGNRFAGNYNTTYTRGAWVGRNNQDYANINQTSAAAVSTQLIDYDYDVSAALGGPIKRDRVWFFMQARDQGKRQTPAGGAFYYNANEGKPGDNYQPDYSRGNVFYKNSWRNGSGRFTWQASRRNKFNFFWDEQDACQDPCDGVVAVYTSPESWWSVATHPNRLQQITWTNPATNRLLLEAGMSFSLQTYDTTHHRYLTNPQSIPRVTEYGTTAGADNNGVRPNTTAGTGFAGLTSGSLNSAIGAGGAERQDLNDYRSRASLSYVTGRHHAKFGYEGAYFVRDDFNQVNDSRLSYRFDTPASNCAATLSCGNTSLYFPSDPNNLALRPVPSQVTINTGSGVLRDRAGFIALYGQDQWTLKRMTVSGALRYDHATSRYLETCVGPDIYVPVQTNGQRSYCTPPADGVSFHDLTPRWGVAYDVFGNGKTSVKWNMGKYLAAAGLNDIYSNANLARRAVNSLTRTWTDSNGNRLPDCDLLNFTANGECGAPTAGQDPVRYGRDPQSLDLAGIPIGLNTTQCGRTEAAVPAVVKAYCATYGNTLLDGWGKRRSEWQFGLGVQQQILPRLSAEITYNRRKYANLTVTDTLGLGCDRFNAGDTNACLQNQLNYSSAQYDFFTVTAPIDPRLPGGGGYVIRGIANPKLTTVTTGLPQAQTLSDELSYTWAGVDTNFVWRGPGGLRLNGGTSTGRALRNTCSTEFDAPNVKGRDGDSLGGGCAIDRPFQTRVNGSASYVIPKIDVLLSTVFQYQPGPEINATVTYNKDQVTWDPASASRATAPCAAPNQALGNGCFVAVTSPQLGTVTASTYQVNLNDYGNIYGEGATLFDLKVAKTIRFGGRRLNVGVDIYNLFNADAISGYTTTYTLAPGTNNWELPTGLVNPRFARLSVQFDF